MKHILIVNNNCRVGGVQKSLQSLLWSIRGQYRVTLCLFSRDGLSPGDLPPEVEVVTCKGPFRYLGISQGQCATLADKLKRGALALICRLFGRQLAIKWMLLWEKPLGGQYDAAISYLHNGRASSFYGGVQDYVLERTDAPRKIAFLHCDYIACGADHKHNNALMARFHCIAACSKGCRDAFLKALPHLEERCVTVENCHRFDTIRSLSRQAAVELGPRIHLLTVARMAHEKALDRALQATAAAVASGYEVTLHMVGDGKERDALESFAKALGIENRVRFYGEQENPYPYMAAADLLLLTSYHEAAPLVIGEAACLGLPVLTVRTTSSQDMVTDTGRGWVCENDGQALCEALLSLLAQPEALTQCRERLKRQIPDNSRALAQFQTLIEG